MEAKTRKYLILMEAEDSTQELLQTLQDTLKNHEEELKKIPVEFEKSKKNILELMKSNEMEIKQVNAQIPVSKSNPDQIRLLNLRLKTLEEKKKELTDSLKALEEKQKTDLENAKNTIQRTKESIDKISSEQEAQNKLQAAQEKTVTESSEENDSILIRRSFARMNEDEAAVPKKQPVIVNFDKSTDTPFQVKFTERGFLIGNTRLSFELLEVAINKEFNITLDNGKGLTLDAVRMQKILKYKDRV